MAQIALNYKPILLTILLLSLILQAQSSQVSGRMSRKAHGLKKEKLSHIHFFFQDVASGDHPTSVPVAKATMTNTSKTLFGAMFVIDDVLTMGPEPTSKIVGRAQGMYASADMEHFGLLMVINYVFLEEKYNGSTLTILGRNSQMTPVREMPIVGGTGMFRFARGYALAKPYYINPKNSDAVIEYNVYVLHY